MIAVLYSTVQYFGRSPLDVTVGRLYFMLSHSLILFGFTIASAMPASFVSHAALTRIIYHSSTHIRP